MISVDIESAEKALDRLGGIREAGAAFKFCPACASPRLYSARDRMWVCPDCGFEYFNNVATAAGIIIDANGSLLLVRRAKQPQKGLFGLPGDSSIRVSGLRMQPCASAGKNWVGRPKKSAFLHRIQTFIGTILFPMRPAICIFTRGAECPPPPISIPIPAKWRKRCFFPADAIPWESVAFDSLRRALRKYIQTMGTGTRPLSAEDGGIE